MAEKKSRRKTKDIKLSIDSDSVSAISQSCDGNVSAQHLNEIIKTPLEQSDLIKSIDDL